MSDLQQQEQPPPLVTQQAYSTHTNHGSVGALVAVLAVITVLGVLAGMIGRLCSGRKVLGHLQYDFEGWVETKCSSCIDGNVDPPPLSNISPDSIPVAVPMQTPEEPNATQHSPPHPHPQHPPETTTQ